MPLTMLLSNFCQLSVSVQILLLCKRCTQLWEIHGFVKIEIVTSFYLTGPVVDRGTSFSFKQFFLNLFLFHGHVPGTCIVSFIILCLSTHNVFGAVAKWLMRWTLDQAVRVQDLVSWS